MKILITLIMFLPIYGLTQLNLEIGAKIGKSTTKIFIPNGSLIDSYIVLSDSIEYTLGVNKQSELVFISTSDPKFSVEGTKIGDFIIGLENENKIGYITGWGYYIQLNENWYAGFDCKSKPKENSKIEWIFSYKFQKNKSNIFRQ